MRSMALVLVLAAGLLAGCGGGDDPETASGFAYEIELPDGWEDRTEEAEDSDVPIRFDLVVGKDRQDGFATNVNIVRESAPEGAGLDEIEPQFESQIESLGARDLSEPRDRMLDGDPAIERDYKLSAQDLELTGRQVFAIHDGRLYTVSFTALESNSGELDEFQRMLDSWQWD